MFSTSPADDVTTDADERERRLVIDSRVASPTSLQPMILLRKRGGRYKGKFSEVQRHCYKRSKHKKEKCLFNTLLSKILYNIIQKFSTENIFFLGVLILFQYLSVFI